MTSTSPARFAPWLSVILAFAAATFARGEVKRPAPPKDYDVSLRFQIRAPLPGWYDRYDEMVAGLKKFGFAPAARPADEPIDPSEDRLTGVIGSENARKLLDQQFVQTILLSPKGLKLQPNDRVKVRLELVSGLSLDRQQPLHRQVVERLGLLGFREAAGYDHRGFLWVLGTIEAGRLDDLLRDLRTVPGGWLVPRDPISTLPLPLRARVPVKVIEVLPEPNDLPPAQEPAPPPALPEGQAHLAKLAPDLRALAARDGDDTKTLRLEVILANVPPEHDQNWERMLRATAPTVVIEGLLGNVATVLVKATQAGELARPVEVVQVRLPRSGEPQRRPALGGAVNAVTETRVGELHQRGYRGQGIKVVIVNGDFTGYQQALPRSTRLLDFTIPRNPSLEPDPIPAGDGALGTGTISALAVHQAAPDAELLLVRIAVDAPQHLYLLAQLINEPGILPRLLEDRYNELQRDRTALELARARAVDERRKALDEQIFDPGAENVPEQRKRFQESQDRIKRAEQAIKDVDQRYTELQGRAVRFLHFRDDLRLLHGTRVVVCPMTWETGWPLDGASVLSRYFDEFPFVGDPGDNKIPTRIKGLQTKRGTVWVQAAGDTRGQTWTGLFRDADGNGAMEFSAADAPLAKDRWTNELNFLAWQGFDGASALDLPSKARVRVTIQWTEPHDPSAAYGTDDPYRAPVVNLSLSVLKQRDPTGAKVASDEMELIARSYGTPVRLQSRTINGTYETSTDFEAVAGGRFAIRVEGTMPGSTRPGADLGGDRVLALEIRPRILVEVIDTESRGKGRVVFQDYAGSDNWPGSPKDLYPAGQSGGVGMPADARRVLAVGSAAIDGKPQPYASLGAGPGRQLLVKPDLLGFDNIDLGHGVKAGGSWVAASFNAGTIACMIGTNAPADPNLLLKMLQTDVQKLNGQWIRVPSTPGAVLRIPVSWLR